MGAPTRGYVPHTLSEINRMNNLVHPRCRAETRPADAQTLECLHPTFPAQLKATALLCNVLFFRAGLCPAWHTRRLK